MLSREVLFTICCLATSDWNVAAESLPDFLTYRWGDAFSTLYGHFSEEVRLEMLQKSREMFTFAYDSYMKYAFPLDELDPIHCSGRGPDEADPTNININDVLGDYSLSLIDSLGTLVIMGNVTEFQKAVKLVVDTVTFDKPNTVQVFEANIRVLGGLLSTHLLIEDQKKTFGNLEPDWYAGNLLTMAHDLADRLIMGFDNATFDIPYPRINLMTGVPNHSGRNKISCLAGAGSLLLEFATLSRLLGDPIYEAYARRSTKSIWKRQSNLTGLFGNDIDVETGEWAGRMSGLGAGMDSFYEYLLKSYILLGEESDLEMFLEAYSAIKMYMRKGRSECNRGTGLHPTYVNVNMDNGQLFNTWMDSLQAAIPALQVLHGDLEEAICHHAYYYAIWKRFGFLPERYNWLLDEAEVKFYPLRPEFIESTYFLYQATKNPFYLHVGHDILESLNKHTKVECGYATVHDVNLKTLEDRQESFFLSETCKYLYLLFDVENPVHKKGSDRFLFTTEGHVFPISAKLRRKVWEEENIVANDHSDRRKGSEPRSNCDSISDERSERVMQFRSPPPSSLNSSRSPAARTNTNPYCEFRGFESLFKLPLKSEYLLQVFNQLGVIS